jgi:hypothetical protein
MLCRPMKVTDCRTIFCFRDDQTWYQWSRLNSLTGYLKCYNIPAIVYMSVNTLFWCLVLLFKETVTFVIACFVTDKNKQQKQYAFSEHVSNTFCTNDVIDEGNLVIYISCLMQYCESSLMKGTCRHVACMGIMTNTNRSLVEKLLGGNTLGKM